MNTTETRHRVALSFGAVLVLGAMSFARSDPARAETTDFQFEITPYIGYQSGGEFAIEGTDEEGNVPSHVSYALALNIRAESEGQYQIFYSRQPTHVDANSELPSGVDIDIDYLHFGGTLRLDPESVLQPYIVGTVGVTLMSPDIPTAHNNQVFSIGFGAGLRIPVRPQFNILMEARGFVSFLPAGGALFCSSGQTGTGCRVHGSGSTFTQYALMVGAAFKF
jgi:hypothetical protein